MMLDEFIDRSHPPCLIWRGAVRDGRPIFRTAMSQRISPITLLVEFAGLKVGYRLKVPSCGNPLCVSPEHNFAPVRDKAELRLSDLSPEQRTEIKRRVLREGVKQGALSRRYRLAPDEAAKAVREALHVA